MQRIWTQPGEDIIEDYSTSIHQTVKPVVSKWSTETFDRLEESSNTILRFVQYERVNHTFQESEFIRLTFMSALKVVPYLCNLEAMWVLELSNREQQKRQCKEEEQCAECHVGPQRRQPHQEGEDHPRQKENSKSGMDILCVTRRISFKYTKPRDQNHSVWKPECPIRCKRSRSKSVSCLEFPHSRETLTNPPIEQCKTWHDVGGWGGLNAPDASVVAGEYEGCEAKSHKS